MKLVVRRGDVVEQVAVRVTGPDSYEVTVGERSYRVAAADVGDGVASLLLDGRQHEVAVHGGPDRAAAGQGATGARYRVAWTGSLPAVEVEVLDPLTHLAETSRAGSGARTAARVTAYMPGRVVAVLAAEGDRVAAGQGVVVLEAMKMENEIAAESAGILRRLFVEKGQAVEGGDPLFEIGE
ncbi:MAG TPA: biotin/lipoyl-containing protein [Thermoanaerobaculia bacterium]|nr:biotin/lipoyl-containing protein [Thermoanaerobaculia bacterium]